MKVCWKTNLIFSSDSCSYSLHDRVEMSLFADAAEVVVPVRRPGDLGVLAGDQRLGPGHRKVVTQRGIDERPVVVRSTARSSPRAWVALERKDSSSLRTLPPALSLSRPDCSGSSRPARFLIFMARIALARPGLHIVEPDVFGAQLGWSGLLAGHRTGVAANALVQVHHHAHLGHHSHQSALLRHRAASVGKSRAAARRGASGGVLPRERRRRRRIPSAMREQRIALRAEIARRRTEEE